MVPGLSPLAEAPLADIVTPNIDLPFVSADTILRTPSVSRNYKLEFAIGGDLTQSLDSSANKLASIIGFGTQDAGFPATNVIAGTTVHYNPVLNTDSNFWQAVWSLTQFITVDLSAATSFNEIQVYLHPLRPTCTAFTVQGSNDNATWFNLYSGSSQPTKVVVRFNDQQSWRYIRFVPNNGGSDGKVRVVAIRVFNWVDETANIHELQPGSGVPDVTLDAKSDMEQSGLATLSEMDVVLMNETGRYSCFNTSSPLYGTLQADGRGSGFRTGINVRMSWIAKATVAGASATTTNKYFFEGFIQNDDSPAGTQGIIFSDPVDTSQKLATVICKSLGTLLDKDIDTPAYEGATGDYIFRDLCYRCGIADQDIFTAGLNQMVPYIAFSKQTALVTMQQMMGANPFMRVFENYTPNAQIAGVNFGRTRSDLNVGVLKNPNFISVGGTQVLIAVPSTKKMYTFDGGFIYVWDQTQPFGKGSNVAGAFNPFGDGRAPYFAWTVGTTLYFAFVNGSANVQLYSYNTLASVFSVASLGTIPSVLTGLGNWRSVGNFLYFSDVSNMYIWDVTKPVSTVRTIAGAASNYVDDTFLAYDSGGSVLIWKHNGTPLTTTFTTVSWTQDSGYGGGGFVGSSHQLYTKYSTGVGPVKSLDLSAAYANPGGTSSVFVADFSQIPGYSAYGATLLGVSGSYIYASYSDANAGVSALMVVNGQGGTGKFFYLGTIAGIPGNNFRTQGGVTFDYTGQLWTILLDFHGGTSFTIAGFKVRGSNTYPPNVSYSFDILDGFTQQIVVSDGNPIANRVQIYNNLMVAQSMASIWTLQNSWSTLKNQKNQFAVALSLSLQGRDLLQTNTSDGTLRTLVLNPQTQNITGGGATTTVTVASTTGIADGQPCVLLGGTPEVRLVLSHTPTTIIFAAVNGSTHTSAVFSQYVGGTLADNPNTTSNVTIGGVAYPCSFWGYSGIAYFNIDTTGQNGVDITSAAIYGIGIGVPTGNFIALDVSDQPSKNLYKQEFLEVLQNPLFNDLSFYQDILTNGKYAKLYLQELDVPWYPAAQLGTLMAVTDTTYGLSAAQFEIVEQKHQGWDTQLVSKNVLSIYKI